MAILWCACKSITYQSWNRWFSTCCNICLRTSSQLSDNSNLIFEHWLEGALFGFPSLGANKPSKHLKATNSFVLFPKSNFGAISTSSARRKKKKKTLKCQKLIEKNNNERCWYWSKHVSLWLIIYPLKVMVLFLWSLPALQWPKTKPGLSQNQTCRHPWKPFPKTFNFLVEGRDQIEDRLPMSPENETAGDGSSLPEMGMEQEMAVILSRQARFLKLFCYLLLLFKK